MHIRRNGWALLKSKAAVFANNLIDPNIKFSLNFQKATQLSRCRSEKDIRYTTRLL
ncbi:hypothetical protein D3C75_431270 [compost metagenome]